MSERKEKCETCRFWDSHDENDVGTCKRLPPTINFLIPLAELLEARDKIRGQRCAAIEPDNQTYANQCWDEIAVPIHADQPKTDADDWCGEYRPARVDPPPAGG